MDPRRSRALAAVLLAATLTGCTGGGEGGGGEPGAAGLGDPYFPELGNGGYDVRHYALTLAYEPRTGRLTGTADITARATQTLSAFNLDLTGLTVHGATVDGAPATVHRSGSEVTLRPGAGLRSGDTFRTVIRYSGTPVTLTDAEGAREGWLRTSDGAVALGEPTGSTTWFPGNHHPSDKATYALTVTVPNGLQAISNGEPAPHRPSGDRTTFTWRSTEPMASYLATLAIGRYETKTSRTPDGIPVHTAARGNAPLLARIPELLAWETKRFGPYPFTSTGAIVDPQIDVQYALETQSRPFFDKNTFDASTLVHELAHQWYGNSVSPESWRDMWLNESFATYAEWLYAEDFADTPAQDSFDEAFADDDNWAFPPADPPTAADISGPPVYGRGAMVLHKIRQAVGDDTFFGILRGWAAKHRHANASTEDFVTYVEDEAGEELTTVWDTYLYGDGRPTGPSA
ncbi:metallopeptidase [Streptomyces sp. CB03234]|uniref:M1 family metallopeptidase n=1 Tax=Streptomyces sp. (strain CB03234) TaxID=1703937 RepID=UPI00093F1EDF|nr:M1 family metallopeptidase [Streptomyces sp. CB03234]OKJ99448.1 metallopeptidase [Streptomyces sp. CB03234]